VENSEPIMCKTVWWELDSHHTVGLPTLNSHHIVA